MIAEHYLSDVSWELRDLPWNMRRDLIAELRGHLDELPTGTDLVGRLGTPKEYAAELRSAAGLQRRHGPIAFVQARRPRNVILVVVVLTAIGLGIGAVAWIQSYQPLAFGHGFRDPDGAVADPAGNGEFVVFHQDRPFEFGVTIRNADSFTVRILGAQNQLEVVSARLFMSQPLEHGGFPEDLTPFRPFDLKPGQVRVLLLKGVFKANCSDWPPGGSTGLFEFPVRFSFLWRTTTAHLRLPGQLAIVFRKGSCPTP
jgi:hypothetical protein